MRGTSNGVGVIDGLPEMEIDGDGVGVALGVELVEGVGAGDSEGCSLGTFVT